MFSLLFKLVWCIQEKLLLKSFLECKLCSWIPSPQAWGEVYSKQNNHTDWCFPWSSDGPDDGDQWMPTPHTAHQCEKKAARWTSSWLWPVLSGRPLHTAPGGCHHNHWHITALSSLQLWHLFRLFLDDISNADHNVQGKTPFLGFKTQSKLMSKVNKKPKNKNKKKRNFQQNFKH